MGHVQEAPFSVEVKQGAPMKLWIQYIGAVQAPGAAQPERIFLVNEFQAVNPSRYKMVDAELPVGSAFFRQIQEHSEHAIHVRGIFERLGDVRIEKNNIRSCLVRFVVFPKNSTCKVVLGLEIVLFQISWLTHTVSVHAE